MSGIYSAFTQSLFTGGAGWTTGSFAVMLVGPGYTPNYGSDTTLANIPSGSQLLPTPVALSGEAVSGGFCKAANVIWTSLTTSAPVDGIAILQNVSGAYNLVAYIDQGSGFGQTDSGQPAAIVWDSRGIFG